MKCFSAVDSFGDKLTLNLLDKDCVKDLGGIITVFQDCSCRSCFDRFDPCVVLKRADARRLIKWLQKAIDEFA